MITFWQALILMGVAVLLAMACVLVGAFVMFRGRRMPGEGFFKEPKGAAFTIPEAEDAAAFPKEPGAEEKSILRNTERFLEKLGGEGMKNERP
jgi:hypothetical protein